MTTTLKQVRANVASKVTGAGFTISRFAPQFFGRIQNTLAHKAFTVDIRTSIDAGERMRRQGPMCETQVQVLFAYRLRPKDVYPTDYDSMLDAEEDIIRAVLGAYNTEMQVRYARSQRNVVESMEYAITTIDFIIIHTLPNS